MSRALALMVGAGLAYVIGRQFEAQQAAADGGAGAADGGESAALWPVSSSLGDWWAPADVAGSGGGVDMNANVRAFLAAIRRGEGTAGVNGYRTIFGGRLFDSFADHPRVYVPWVDKGGIQRTSSAAGAYQIIVATWDRVAKKLALPDFSPASQDAAALELIRQRGALADVQAGRLSAAVAKTRAEWASLPGAGYGQPEQTFAALQAAYVAAGGMVTG